MNTNPLDVGTAIRRRRRELDLSQAALADLAGLSQNYLSLVETGQRTPSLETLALVAESLHVPPSYLVLQAQLAAAERTPATAESVRDTDGKDQALAIARRMERVARELIRGQDEMRRTRKHRIGTSSS
jgi:transcriptional regulator with XRE-family HTH domain